MFSDSDPRSEVFNYGAPMGSCNRSHYFPERAERRAKGSPDPLVRKSYFACGEAAKRGWMLLVWENPYMREIVKKRIELSQLEPTIPLP